MQIVSAVLIYLKKGVTHLSTIGKSQDPATVVPSLFVFTGPATKIVFGFGASWKLER